MSDELEVLLSIYPELVVRDRTLTIEIAVYSDVGKNLIFETLPSFEVNHLPPLEAEICLVDEYPTTTEPDVTLRCPWLEQDCLQKLRLECLALWQPGEEVLYSIFDHLQSAADTAFGHNQRDLHVKDRLYSVLSNYQLSATAREFAKHSYDCGICLEWRNGSECISLCSNKHVFCKPCLRDMFGLHIKEGAVNLVRCPLCPYSEDESKDSSMPLLPRGTDGPSSKLPLSILKHIITTEELERYVKLQRKKELEALPSSTYCPRDFCATVLARNPDEKLVVCTNCELAFCADCKKTWHGPMEPCKRLPLNSDLAILYKSLLADVEKSGERQSLERLYGRKTLERLLIAVEDEKLVEKWRLENAQACPACGTYIEKSYGCNHLQCTICTTHFCFLCGEQLSSHNPYSHYSDKGISCYGKLFQGLTGLEDPFGGLDVGFE